LPTVVERFSQFAAVSQLIIVVASSIWQSLLIVWMYSFVRTFSHGQRCILGAGVIMVAATCNLQLCHSK